MTKYEWYDYFTIFICLFLITIASAIVIIIYFVRILYKRVFTRHRRFVFYILHWREIVFCLSLFFFFLQLFNQLQQYSNCNIRRPFEIVTTLLTTNFTMRINNMSSFKE